MNELITMTVEVSRGTTHNGPGLRTTIFMKGCPLACRWCQNPESISASQEIWYEARKCIGCLDCISTCTNAALEAGDTGVIIHRGKCRGCGDCADACPAKALALTGTVWMVDELVHEVMKDASYYHEFGGGVTVSGGEPLIHADFLVEFFQKLRANGIHMALDTCGHTPSTTVMRVVSCVDAVLYDVKLMNPDKHKILTGRDNTLILSNLNMIAAYIRKTQKDTGSAMLLWIRTPLIPGDTATEETIGQIADYLAANISDVMERWELCAFNRLRKKSLSGRDMRLLRHFRRLIGA